MPTRTKKAAALSPEEALAEAERHAEFQRRVEEGSERARRRRQEEANAETERLRIEKEKHGLSDEERNPPATTGQILCNLLIAVVFISFPLSEPRIDWIGVAAMAAINIVWNLFFHASTWIHIITLFLINCVCVQYYNRFANLPMAILSLGPQRLAYYGGGNATVLIMGYIVYVRRTPSHQRGNSWDVLVSSMLLMNFLSLIVTGTLTMNEARSIFRGVVSIVTDLPPPAGSSESDQHQYQQHFGGADGGASGGGPNPPGADGSRDNYQQQQQQQQQHQQHPGAGDAGSFGGHSSRGSDPNQKMPQFPPGVDVEFF